MARLFVFPKRFPPTTTITPPHCDKQGLHVDHNAITPITRIRTQSYAILGAEPTKPFVPELLPGRQRFHEDNNRVEIDWNDDPQDLNGYLEESLDEDAYSSQELFGNREWKRSRGLPESGGGDNSHYNPLTVNVPVSIVDYDTVDANALLESINSSAPPVSEFYSQRLGISLLHTVTSTGVYNQSSLLSPLNPFEKGTLIDGLGNLYGTNFSTTTCAPIGEWALIESPIRLSLLVLLSLFNAYIIFGNLLVILGTFMLLQPNICL